MPTPLQSYLHLSRPWQLPPPWGEFARCEHAFIGPASIAEAQNILTTHHSQNELFESGLMQLDPDGQLVIHPFLAMPDVAFLVLIDRTSGEICDLLTAAGSIRDRGLALYAALTDKTTCGALNRNAGRLLLAGSWDDAMVLRSAGLAAVPIHGLAEFTGENLQRLGAQYRIVDQATPIPADRGGPRDPEHHAIGSPAPIDPDHIDLTLVNWSPSALSPDQPEPIRTAISRLRGLYELWGLSIQRIEVWTPTPDDWPRIHSAVEEKRLDWFVTVGEDSRGYDSVLPLPTADGPAKKQANSATAPDDLAAATRRLAECDLAPGDRRDLERRRRDAETKYRKSHQRTITEPLLREAQAADDPVRAALCDHLAGLTQVHAENMISFHATRATNHQINDDPQDQSLSQIIAIGNQIAKLHDTLSRPKPHPPWRRKK